MVDPDTQLMVNYCAGEAAAFRDLLQRNNAIVFKLACRYLGDPTEAEDVVQDVFIRVHGAARDYKPTAKFTTWLYRITVNVCLNRLRSSKVHATVSLDATPTEDDEPMAGIASEPAEAPSAKLEREELEVKVREAMACLPESQRTAVLLRRFHEMSYEEIAEVMQTTVPAVKSLLARARQTLKSMLGKYL